MENLKAVNFSFSVSLRLLRVSVKISRNLINRRQCAFCFFARTSERNSNKFPSARTNTPEPKTKAATRSASRPQNNKNAPAGKISCKDSAAEFAELRPFRHLLKSNPHPFRRRLDKTARRHASAKSERSSAKFFPQIRALARLPDSARFLRARGQSRQFFRPRPCSAKRIKIRSKPTPERESKQTVRATNEAGKLIFA